jgi:cytochrome c peroxidase
MLPRHLIPSLLLSISCTSFVMAADVAAVADAKSTGAVELGDPRLTSGIPGAGPLTDAQIATWLANPANHKPLDFTLPKGLDAGEANVFVPENNPITLAKIELGRQLYFDTRLSADSSVSCASCHDPAQGYGANTQFGVGIRKQEGGRNSPVSYNRVLSREQFWDGRAATLEDQAVGPIANTIEMGNTHDACVKCLAGIPGYKKQFDVIFEDGVTIDNVGKALATFERVLVTGPTPYDYENELRNFEKVFAADLEEIDAIKEEDPEFYEQYQTLKKASADNPMSEAAARGMTLFAGKANCATCHAGANFTDEQYHNLGVGMESANPDLGRFVITKDDAHRGAFKTPTLRNVALSPPYMHDGSQATLEEVIEWYNIGGHKNDWLSDKMKPLNLTAQEKADLVAFMKEGLNGEFPVVETGRLPK